MGRGASSGCRLARPVLSTHVGIAVWAQVFCCIDPAGFVEVGTDWTGRRVLQCQCLTLLSEDGVCQGSRSFLGRAVCSRPLEALLGCGFWKLVFGRVSWPVAILSQRLMAARSGLQRSLLHGTGWRIWQCLGSQLFWGQFWILRQCSRLTFQALLCSAPESYSQASHLSQNRG